MMTVLEFISRTQGKRFNIDNAYGYQCWDFFAYFCQCAGYKQVNCTSTGYVIDIWRDRKTNGTLKNFAEVSKDKVMPGDWIIWGKSPYGTSHSHIAMVTKVLGGNKVQVLDQYSAKSVVSHEALTMEGIAGILRPNCWKDVIVVDGYWGIKTTKKAQKVFKTTVDGIVSNQYKMYKAKNPGLQPDTWQWLSKPSKAGSQLIKAIQHKVGASVNGYIGPETIGKMQKWLGTTQDGYVSNPSQMIKAFQCWLNQQ